MKTLALLCALAFAAACNSGGVTCQTDHCVCPTDDACEHTCTPGGNECHIQCGFGQDCDVTCAPGEECHVEATHASHLTVDCNGGTDCHVTCPAAGCTVTECVGDCVVACGLTGNVATRNGTTATCP